MAEETEQTTEAPQEEPGILSQAGNFLWDAFIWDDEQSLTSNLFWTGVTIVSVGGAAFTGGLSLSGLALRGAAKTAAKAVLKTGAKTAAKTAEKGTTKAITKMAAKETAETAAKATTKETAEEIAKRLAKKKSAGKTVATSGATGNVTNTASKAKDKTQDVEMKAINLRLKMIERRMRWESSTFASKTQAFLLNSGKLGKATAATMRIGRGVLTSGTTITIGLLFADKVTNNALSKSAADFTLYTADHLKENYPEYAKTLKNVAPAIAEGAAGLIMMPIDSVKSYVARLTNIDDPNDPKVKFVANTLAGNTLTNVMAAGGVDISLESAMTLYEKAAQQKNPEKYIRESLVTQYGASKEMVSGLFRGNNGNSLEPTSFDKLKGSLKRNWTPTIEKVKDKAHDLVEDAKGFSWSNMMKSFPEATAFLMGIVSWIEGKINDFLESVSKGTMLEQGDGKSRVAGVVAQSTSSTPEKPITVTRVDHQGEEQSGKLDKKPAQTPLKHTTPPEDIMIRKA